MAQNGAVMNYDFGTKKNWRRWAWNRIAERVVSKRSAFCLYLPGKDDVDREVALSKGFSASNLIGIERDRTTRDLLRKAGVLCVDADVFDAVMAFSIQQRKVDVVFLDLCNGLTKRTIKQMSYWIRNPHMRDCVFAVNLMRGRDAETNIIRRAIEDEETGRHRARLLLHSVLFFAAGWWRAWDELDATEREMAERVYSEMLKRARPTFSSYRSTSRQTFDSLVFRNPVHTARKTPEEDKIFDAWVRKHVGKFGEGVTRARRSVAAVMAHRTRRINGVAVCEVMCDVDDRN